MPFVKGKPRHPGAGRKKGSPNKKTQDLMEKAKELGIDPFEILLHLANGDWKTLGYDAPGVVKKDKYCEWLELTITTDTRARAASDAAQYLYPKRKAIEHSGPNGEPLITNLTDLVKKIANTPTHE